MNRNLGLGLGLGAGLLILAGLLLYEPGPGAPPAGPTPETPTKTAPVAPKATTNPIVPTTEHRVALATGRTREEGLPKRRLADLEDPKETHRQAILEIKERMLTPCIPRPSLRDENFTRRLEIDYLLQPTGIVEVQVRGVSETREEMEVDGALLDCFASKVQALGGPGVQGEVHHRFVYAYRTPEPLE